ncbi:hypothetical protein JCM5350_006525 [Sporobolomyces pararoseus]
MLFKSSSSSSLIVFDDTDTSTISYSTTWVGYQGQVGNIDARDWVGSSFHACRAEPLNGSQPCWANITFTGSSISLFAEHSNAQSRYWCGLLGEEGGDSYKWFNGSSLEREKEGTPFVWSLNNTRCAVNGLDGSKQHTLAFGQLAEDTQGVGITLDYYSVDPSQGSANAKPSWSSDFVSLGAPPGISWAADSTSTDPTSSSATRTSASATTSSSSSTNSLATKVSSSSSSSADPNATATADSSNSSSSSGGLSSGATTGIGVGLGLGALALLVLSGLLLWRNKKRKRNELGRTGSIAPTETTYGGFQSVSGGSPVSRNGRGRFGSTSQSYLPSYNASGAVSEYGGRVPEVQAADDQLNSPATTFATNGGAVGGGDPSSRFLANPATFRER